MAKDDIRHSLGISAVKPACLHRYCRSLSAPSLVPGRLPLLLLPGNGIREHLGVLRRRDELAHLAAAATAPAPQHTGYVLHMHLMGSKIN